jgi:mannitol-1-phosphate 5-dehydrogenase
VVYTAENHNHAAEILEQAVLAQIPSVEHAVVCSRVCFLNSVIGKMSGIVSDPNEIFGRHLIPITPGASRAFLVESFNRILISNSQFKHGFERGIEVFEEKPNLLPFEEAKLYGHNATHALAAYLGAALDVSYVANLRANPKVMSFLRDAFVEESGQALIRKYGDLDPLFTTAGYQQYADDLLERMTNPYLGDTVERVARDPQRKLGWDDRLLGTMRLALQQGVTPRRYAWGVVAALMTMPIQDSATSHPVLDLTIPLSTWLKPLWAATSPDQTEQELVLNLIEDSRREFKHWFETNSQDTL